MLWASIIHMLFYFVCCLVSVKSLKLEMGKFKVVQSNISSGISASVSAIFQKFSWLNFSCDHHKSWLHSFFPSVSAYTSPRLLYLLEFRSMTQENFTVIKETLKVDRVIAIIFMDDKHTKVLSLLPQKKENFIQYFGRWLHQKKVLTILHNPGFPMHNLFIPTDEDIN